MAVLPNIPEVHFVPGPLPIPALVLCHACIDGFRAAQMLQDKAQPAGNGSSLSRAATPDWSIWAAPCGRAVKQLSAVLRRLVRTSHYRRGAPCGQQLHGALNLTIQAWQSTTCSDAPGLELPSTYSYGYWSLSSPASSRICPAPSSGILVKYAG